MLSRTAESLYWIARYMERAENIARLLDVGGRMASLSLDAEVDTREWESTLLASGCAASYAAGREVPAGPAIIEHLARDASNPSSIVSCFATARRNARAVRTALTADMWEAINAAWLDLPHVAEAPLTLETIRPFVDWVKERSQLFGGAVNNTMLRNDAYWFVRLGTLIERADSTARILDVKYNVLLPHYEEVGGTLDYYQWAAILRSVSARRAYHWVYRDRMQPWNVAELLILRPEMPRSLISCLGEITTTLDLLADAYGGVRGECHRLAGRLHAQLRYAKIDAIFGGGLHEYLTAFIGENTELGQEISRQYLL